MATKDTIKSAQSLLDTFGPVVEALPAVITALKDQDSLERRKAQLASEFNALVDAFNAKLADLEKVDADMVARKNARQDEFNKMELEGQAAVKELQTKQRELTSKITAKRKELETAELDTARLVNEARAKLDAEMKALEVEGVARRTELAAATAEAEKKFAATVKKLEDLKAKL